RGRACERAQRFGAGEELGVQLLIGELGNAEQRFLADIGGRERVADFAVDPIEDAHVALARVAECRLAVGRRIRAYVESDARTLVGLGPEMRDNAVFAAE